MGIEQRKFFQEVYNILRDYLIQKKIFFLDTQEDPENVCPEVKEYPPYRLQSISFGVRLRNIHNAELRAELQVGFGFIGLVFSIKPKNDNTFYRDAAIGTRTSNLEDLLKDKKAIHDALDTIFFYANKWKADGLTE